MDKFKTYTICSFKTLTPYDTAQECKQYPLEAWEWIKATVDEAMEEKAKEKTDATV